MAREELKRFRDQNRARGRVRLDCWITGRAYKRLKELNLGESLGDTVSRIVMTRKNTRANIRSAFQYLEEHARE
jgi:hypothetical protein